MYSVMKETKDNVIGLKVEGKLTATDYEVLVPYLEEAIVKQGKLRLVADMTTFTGMELAAAWADMKFCLGHLRDFDRMAVIGDQTWLNWTIWLTNLVVKAEFRTFGADESKAAWTWIHGDMEKAA